MHSTSEEGSIVVVLTTLPDRDSAARIARTLVDERLAACVTLLPGITSVFRFEGTVHEDPEVLLLIKTTGAAAPAVERRLGALHPYDVPEFVVLDAASVAAPYAGWLRSVVG